MSFQGLITDLIYDYLFNDNGNWWVILANLFSLVYNYSGPLYTRVTSGIVVTVLPLIAYAREVIRHFLYSQAILAD